MSACPDKELLLHALVDGELDAGNALALEAHIAGCPGCAAELAAIREIKARLKAAPLAYTAQRSLLDRLDAALLEAEAPLPSPRRQRLRIETWVLGGAGAAIAASLALLAILPSGASLQSQLVDAQVRSSRPSTWSTCRPPIDIRSSPGSTARSTSPRRWSTWRRRATPWSAAGLERIDGRRVAALVFHREAHVINLFIWPGDAPSDPLMQQKDGYNLVRWGAGGLVFWAVSDCDPSALTGFQKDFAAATS